MKRLIGAMAAALALMVATVAVASAGGWSTVTVNSRPDVIQSGEEFTVEFTVLQHGMSPMDDLSPSVTFTNESSNQTVTADATPTGEAGQYSITAALPESGTWQWSVKAFEGPHRMAPFDVASGEVAGTSASSGITGKPLALALLGIGAVSGLTAIGISTSSFWPSRRRMLAESEIR